MQRTTVKLPDDLDARLRHEAERRGITVSQLTREAIETHLGATGRDDISERIEELLRADAASKTVMRRPARKATPPSH